MKFIFRATCFGMAAWVLQACQAQAADVMKADVADNLNLGSSWVGSTAPTASDVAVWDNTVQANLTSMPGAALDWGGIKVLDPAGLITIGADGNSLTTEALGIDLSQATNGLTINCPLVLGADQTWSVTNGLSLTLGDVVSGAGALTISGGGTVVLPAANTYTADTIINGSIAEARNATSFSGGTVNVNDGSTLRVHSSSTLKNAFVFSGSDIIDLDNAGNNTALDGSWSGTGNITIINQDGSASRVFTFGGGGNDGGSMANFTGSISLGTNSGVFRFNDGGSSQNTGSDNAAFDLGTGAASFYTRNKNAAVHFGALTGGPNTIIRQGSSSSGTSIYTIGGLNTSTTFAGTIQDGGGSSAGIALTKIGSGTLTLTGTNTYVGVTTISDGTLQVGDGGTIGELGTGAIINNATLVYNHSDDISISNALSGSGTTIKLGANTMTYYGTDTAFGSLEVDAGTLVVGSSASIGSTIDLLSGTTLDVSQSSSFTLASTLSGNGTVTGALTVAGGTISPGGNGAAGTLTLADGLTEQGSASQRFEISAPGSTNDQIVVTGDLNLSGANTVVVAPFRHSTIAEGTYTLITYSGQLNGSLDNLSLAISGAFGMLTNPPGQIALIVTPPPRNPTNLVWVGDGSANLWDFYTSTNWMSGGTEFTFLNGDSVTFNDSGAANPVVNITDTVLPASVTVNATSDYTFTGAGEIRGATGLIKTNSGMLTMDATNSYTGPTMIEGGVLQVSSVADAGQDSPMGAAAGDSTNLVLNSATLRYSSADSSGMNRSMMLAGDGTIDVTNDAANLTISGSIEGPGMLTKAGGGSLTVNAANSFGGGTTISNGMVILGSNSANGSGNNSGVGTNSSPVVFHGGTLQLYGYSASTSPTYNSFRNPLVVPAGQTGTLQLYPRASGLYSSLTGSGTLNLVVNYLRDDLVGDWSAFSGIINVTSKGNPDGNEFRIHNTYGYENATINLNDAVLMDTVVSGDMKIGALGGNSQAVIGKGSKSKANPTWSIGWNNADSTYAGSIQDDGATSLIKVGTGTLTLMGGSVTNVSTPDGFTFYTNVAYANLLEYSGSTTINNGVLKVVVPDALTNSSTITLAYPAAVLDASDMGYVSNYFDSTVTNQYLITNGLFEVVSGQTLEGLGTILGDLQVDGGASLNVGLPTGSLTVTNNANLVGAITMNINVTNAATSSELMAANFVIDPAATLTINNLGPEAGGTFHLFNKAVNFTTVNLPTPTGTNMWVNNLAVDGTVTLEAPSLPIVNANPTNIMTSFNSGAGTLTLEWPQDHTGWTLQVQTNTLASGLGTNWVDVAGSTTTNRVTIPVDANNGSVFYRMIYQP